MNSLKRNGHKCKLQFMCFLLLAQAGQADSMPGETIEK